MGVDVNRSKLTNPFVRSFSPEPDRRVPDTTACIMHSSCDGDQFELRKHLQTRATLILPG